MATMTRQDVSTPQRRRRARWPIALALLVALVVGFGWVASSTSVLDVREVMVVGAQRAGPEQVRRAADIGLGMPMLRVSAGDVERRVEAIPAVEDVEVRFGWPHTIVLAITERIAVAAAPSTAQSGRSFELLSADGVSIGSAPTRSGLPVLPAGGTAPAALAVAAALPTDFRATVLEIRAPTPDGVDLELESGVLVRFGGPTEAVTKVAVITKLMRTNPARIDVSDPEFPATAGRLRQSS